MPFDHNPFILYAYFQNFNIQSFVLEKSLKETDISTFEDRCNSNLALSNLLAINAPPCDNVSSNQIVLTCSCRAYYIFSGPPCGVIFSENSEKISLSMKRCPDNQINASFIDISRIKWLVFLLRSSFFRTTSTVASSEAPADYRPAPGRTDGIPERRQRQWI